MQMQNSNEVSFLKSVISILKIGISKKETGSSKSGPHSVRNTLLGQTNSNGSALSAEEP